KRFPAGEGRLYAVGGFAASYLRRGDTVLIPVRLGVGWRAGVNVGYMNFTEKHKWLPF
ncbi:MAG TPA: EipA family protein, partial [Sphingomonas sp.]